MGVKMNLIKEIENITKEDFPYRKLRDFSSPQLIHRYGGSHNISLFFLATILSLVLFLCPYFGRFAFSQGSEDNIGIDMEGLPMEPTGEELLMEPTGEELLMEPTGEELLIDSVEEEALTNEEGYEEGYAVINIEQDSDSSEERISLDLKGIDILELFRLLSIKTGLTIVPSKGVKGRINLFLNNVTFEDTLDVILITQDLACEKMGNILMIMTSDEYKTRYGKSYDEKREFRSFKLSYAKPSAVFEMLSQLKSDIGKIMVDESSGTVILIDIPEKIDLMQNTAADLDKPLDTEIFDLRYANTEDMKTHIESVITSGTGLALVDKDSSKMAVSDLPEKMKKIRRIVGEFDDEPQEVFIEAEIWQISLKNEYQRGIDWEKVFKGVAEILPGGNPDITLVGTMPVSPSFSPSPALTTASLEMQVGTLADHNYTSTLQLLETYGDVKIISRPNISVVSKQEASIMVGSREAYVTQTLSQGETTTVTSENIEFIDVGIKLNVVPTINIDGMITMTIKPEISSVRETLTTSLGSVVPIVETSEAETVVKVEDGRMIIIAGLLREEERETITGIPLLSKIPILGALFGSRATLKQNTELAILLTPHIVSGRVSMVKEERMPSSPDVAQAKIPKFLKFGAKEEREAISEKKAEILNLKLKSRLKGLKEYDQE